MKKQLVLRKVELKIVIKIYHVDATNLRQKKYFALMINCKTKVQLLILLIKVNE